MRLIVKDDEFERSYEIPEGESIVGRSPECDISIPASTLSKKHAKIDRRGDEVSIQDLGATNGTYLNGMKVRMADVKHQDVITLGRVRLVLDIMGDSNAAGGGPAGAAAVTDSPIFFDEPTAEQPDEAPGTEGPIPGQNAEPPGMDMPPPGTDAPDGVMPDGQPFESGPEASEKTPADGDFMPARYEPERQHGPQLVARGDRWFIKDPATDREVEIAPKGGPGGQPNIAGYYAGEQKKKKINQVILAAAGIISALVILLIVLPGGEPVKPPKKTFPAAQYDSLVNAGIDALKAKEYEKAASMFNKAHTNSRKRRVAGILAEINDMWKNAGEDLSDLDWVNAQARLEDLQDAAYRTAKSSSFAEEQLTWIKREQQQKRILAKAESLFHAGELEEAYRYVNALRDGPVKAGSIDFAEQVRAACEDKFLTQADQLKDNRDWQAAIDAYNKAAKYVKDGTESINACVEECRDAIQQMTYYEDAVAMNDQGRYSEAIEKLKLIPEDSPYATDAASLMKTAIVAKKKKRANGLFDAGKGQEALTYISTELADGQAPPGLEGLIEETLELHEAAGKAYEDRRLLDAINTWTEIETLLADRPDNYYRQDAEDKRSELEESGRSLANFFAEKANQYLIEDKPGLARKYADIANKYHPGAGDAVLKDILRTGKRHYFDGASLYYDKKYAEALKELKDAMRYLTSEDQRYAQALNLHNQAKKKMKEF